LAAYNVVITGATKGVGKALAQEFVRAGDNVVVASRSPDRVAATVAELDELARQLGNNGTRVVGCTANVAAAADVAVLASTATEALGTIDIWINNAGTNSYTFKPLMEQEAEEIAAVVQTNVLGVLLGCREAIKVMRKQSQGGHIFNMDGAGADGGATPRFAAYGATKRSLDQLGKSLRAELQFAGVRNVGIHNLSPGMVTTELLMAGADNKASKWFINCLAEEPETVAVWMVPRIRNIVDAANGPIGNWRGALGTGEYLRFLTKPRAYSQIFKKLVVGERKNRFVPED
jgi:chlorophyll(ide) b reductase